MAAKMAAGTYNFVTNSARRLMLVSRHVLGVKLFNADWSPNEALLLRHGSVVWFSYITHRVARAVIIFINMANSSHLGFCVKMVSKLFTNVYNGNAFEENDTSFVFLSHWVPALINLNIFQNGGWRPSWIYALHGHSRRQLLVRIDSLTPKTYVLTPISTL